MSEFVSENQAFLLTGVEYQFFPSCKQLDLSLVYTDNRASNCWSFGGVFGFEKHQISDLKAIFGFGWEYPPFRFRSFPTLRGRLGS